MNTWVPDLNAGTIDFGRIFEVFPAPYLILTPDLVVAAVNEAYLEATMVRREDIVGREIFSLFPENSTDSHAVEKASLRMSLERVLATRAPDSMAVQRYDIRQPSIAGGGLEERWWSVANVPVLDDQNCVRYIIHRVEDVTTFIRQGWKPSEAVGDSKHDVLAAPIEELEAEVFVRSKEMRDATSRLRFANEHLRLALQAGRSGSFNWEPQSNACQWSEELLALYGLESFGGRYQDWLDCILPEDQAAAESAFLEALRTGQVTAEFRIRRRDNGEVRWIHGRAAVFFDAQSRPRQVIGIQMDVTESRQAEAERRKQALLLDIAPDPIFAWEEDSGIRYWNHGSEQLYGYSSSEALNKSSHALLKTVFPVSREACLRELAQTGRWAGELSQTTRDGRELVVDCWMRRLIVDGKVLVLEANRDITERKRLEDKLRRMNHALENRVAARTAELAHANAALERSNLELQQFAFIAAHDLKTPLRSITGFAQLLHKEYHSHLGAQADAWLDQLQCSSRKMFELVSDLLAYSRVDSRGKAFQPVDMQQLFAEVLATLEAPIREIGAQVSCGALPVVSGDRTQLAQVLQNLLDNAIKYHGSDSPKARVAAWNQGGEWVFSIKDNGIGIADRHREHIFDIFHRLHTQQAYPGTGIGLAVCRRVIYRHGGRIWVESEPGRGSTFFFTVPDKS